MNIERSCSGTTLDTRTLDSRYVTALIFSIYEGLVPGESFTVICSETPKVMTELLLEAKIQNIQFQTARQSDASWTLIINKTKSKSAEQNCCGVCGIGKDQ